MEGVSSELARTQKQSRNVERKQQKEKLTSLEQIRICLGTMIASRAITTRIRRKIMIRFLMS